MANVAIVEAALRLDAKQFSKGIEQAKDSVAKLAGDARGLGAAAGAGLLAISAGAGALALNLKTAGDFADGIADSLASAFTGDELDAITKKALELGALGIFTEAQFADAAKRLNTFGKDAEKNLQRVADVAAKTGASFDAVAEALAQFGSNEKGTKALLKLTGLKPGDLEKYGAVLDATGTKLDIAGKNGDLAVAAFEKLADIEFSGAFLAGTDGASQFTAELKLLQQELGSGIVTAFEDLGGKIAPVIKFFRSFSDETKGLVGVGILTASLAAGLGAVGIAGALAASSMLATVAASGGFVAVLAPLGALLAPVVGSLAAFAAAGLTATAIVVGLNEAYKGLNNALEGDLKLQGELLATELERQSYQKLIPQFLGKTAQQLYDVGLTAMDAGKAIDGLYQQRGQASANGATDLVKQLDQRIAEIEKSKLDLTKLEDRDRGRVAAREADPAGEESEKRRKEREKKAADARKKELDAELDAIELRLASEEITQEKSLELRRQALIKYEADEETKRALAIETARFETQAANDAVKQGDANSEATLKKKFDDELTRIDLLKSQRKISAQQEADLLKNVLNTFAITEAEKVTLLKQVAAIENGLLDSTAAKRKAILDQQAADEKTAADARIALIKQNSADLEDAQAQGRGLKSAGLDRKVDSLQEDTQATGKDNTSAIKSAAEEKLKLDLEAIRLEGDKAKAATESAEAREQIEANTLERIKAAQEAATDSLKSELQQQLEALAKFEADKKKQRGAFSLGGVTGIDQLGENTGGYGISRRAEAISPVSTANLFANVAAPISNVSNDPSMDKLDAAADKLLAAAGKLSTAADKPTKVQVVGVDESNRRMATVSVNGRMGSAEKASRGMSGPVGAR
jgi:hypothetical protein